MDGTSEIAQQSASDVRPLEDGAVLAGKYRIGRLLGEGGGGFVYEALHMHLRTRVAIKVLRGEPTMETLQRMKREAQAVAQLQSDHVVRVFDLGDYGDGAPYIAMELLEGRPLSQVLREHGALSIQEAVGYVLEACEGLAAAHSQGVVHRDLKPSNLFLCERRGKTPVLKVLDFGVARRLDTGALDADGETLTHTNAVLGTPGYMAPEQIGAPSDVDHRADIWAIGVVLRELMTGQRPSRSGERLRSELPKVPAELDMVIQRCIAPARQDRFADIAELAAALEPFGPPDSLERVGRIASTLKSAAVDTTRAPRTQAQALVMRGERDPRRSRWVLTSLLVFTATLSGGWFVGTMRSNHEKPEVVGSGVVPSASPAPSSINQPAETPFQTQDPSTPPSSLPRDPTSPPAKSARTIPSGRPTAQPPRRPETIEPIPSAPKPTNPSGDAPARCGDECPVEKGLQEALDTMNKPQRQHE